MKYDDSGVNIEKATKANRAMSDAVRSTWNESVLSEVGHFGGLFSAPADYRDPVLVSSMDGVGTMMGALFGSAFPTTVYIGHPGYKRLGARAGYAFGVGVVFYAGSLFGLVAFLFHLIPMAAAAPILVYIGLVIVGQAFRSTPAAHAMAVAVAMIPHVSNLLMTKWLSLAKVLAGSGGVLFEGGTMESMKREGCHVAGHAALFNGSILIGLLWGAITAFLLDGKHLAASGTAAAAMVLTATGLIHSPVLEIRITPIFWGYAVMAALCLLTCDRQHATGS